jgi:hypothetical protein
MTMSQSDLRERTLPAAVAFVRMHAWRILLLSALITIPCFWHPRIQAGDLGSHVYNAWLAQLVDNDQAPGVFVVQQWNNVLFDLALSWAGKWLGLPAAEKLVVPIAMLLFFWGSFALASAASQKPAWYLTPVIAMLSYGWTFNAGFLNYYLALGFAFFGVAIYWGGRGMERLWAITLAPLVYMAHPTALIWLAGTVAYIEISERLAGWKRLFLLPSAAIALVAIRYYVALRNEVGYSRDPFYWYNGVDQLWLFGNHYAILSRILWITCAAWVIYDLIQKRKAGVSWAGFRIPLELYAISVCAVILLPNTMRPPEALFGLGMIIPRFTSIVATLGLCVFACVDLRKSHLAGLLIAAAIFFTFLYSDTRQLNNLEEQAGRLISQIPPGRRLAFTFLPPKTSRVAFFVHLVDRACIGRCYSYSNYEPSTGQFRVRVRMGSPVLSDNARKACELERGYYVVQPEDLPLYQIYQPEEDPMNLRIRELQAGEENGRIGLRPAVNPCPFISPAPKLRPKR